MIQLTVQGIYREFTENVMYADLYMSFSRTFILKPMRKEIVSVSYIVIICT